MNKSLILPIAVLFALCASQDVYANINTVNKTAYNFSQVVTPHNLDSWSSGGYFSSGGRIYNVKSGILCDLNGTIKKLAVSPNGKSMAVIYTANNGREYVHVGDLWERSKRLFKSNKEHYPVAVGYSFNGDILLIADYDSNIYFYNNHNFKLSKHLPVGDLVDALAMSADSRYLATASGNTVKLWDVESNQMVDRIQLKGLVKSMEFTDKHQTLTILTDDSLFTLYDVKSLSVTKNIKNLGIASDCDLHIDEKYLAVVTDSKRITVVNIHNDNDRTYYDNNIGGITDVKFVKDSKGMDFLMYNTSNSIVYQPLSDLLPNYTMLLNDELDTRMEAWTQRMEGESLEQYQLRVNDQSISAQRKLYEEEISTELADNLIASSDITLGNFNMQTNTLAVNVSTMPTFYLNVPTEDVGMFTDTSNLEFSNAIYGVNENDEFELLYIDVYNKKTGETYNFDNRERKSLKYMESDEGFMPVDMVLLHNAEMQKLEEIKQDVVAQAIEQQVITENTDIDISTDMQNSKDRYGNNTIDYIIRFQYNVAAEFTAEEDFAPGEYHIEDSGSAQSMCQIIERAFQGEFAQYIKPGAELQVTVTGMADQMKVVSCMVYDGSYGKFIKHPVNGGTQFITVSRSTGIRNNEELALIRAAGLKEAIVNNLPALADMKVDYKYNIKVAEQSGGEYRRITVEFKFLNAL